MAEFFQMTTSVETSRRFSVAAAHYDEAAHIQRTLALELAERVTIIHSGNKVVDVGSGTGRLLKDLQRKEPGAVYVGVDAAEGMLALAEGLRVRADHARLPFKPDSIDRVVSSSCYQWATDLRQAFTSVADVLKPGGCFSAVLFGRDTLNELFMSLAQGSRELSLQLLSVPRPPLARDVCRALVLAGFTHFDHETDVRQVRFGSIRKILCWLKATGANGPRRGIFIGKEALRRAENYYQMHYDGKVSFEVIWLEARK